MITQGDDYLVHQTCAPITEVGTTDRNFYDRYFFNGYSRDGEVFFATALGLYPNRQVMDAAFSVVHRGRQYVVRASRRAGTERMESRVGPVAVSVLKPLESWRVTVDPNPWGISADLRFSARIRPLQEPRFYREVGGRVFMDYTRLTQHVAVDGRLCIDGEEVAVAADRYWGCRDRSWGIRPVGEREESEPAAPVQFYWLWSPVNFEDLCTHFDVNEDADGQRWHEVGVWAPVDAEPETAAAVDYSIDHRKGTRHARSAQVTLGLAAGDRHVIELEPLYNFYMVGLGYMHPEWGHGMFVGEDEATGESWLLREVDASVPLHLHVQGVCEAKLEGRRGIGVFEQLVLGPHRPSGFDGLFEGAA
jgi:hypothetical protein